MTYAYLIEVMKEYRRGKMTKAEKLAMACAIGLWQAGGARL